MKIRLWVIGSCDTPVPDSLAAVSCTWSIAGGGRVGGFWHPNSVQMLAVRAVCSFVWRLFTCSSVLFIIEYNGLHQEKVVVVVVEIHIFQLKRSPNFNIQKVARPHIFLTPFLNWLNIYKDWWMWFQCRPILAANRALCVQMKSALAAVNWVGTACVFADSKQEGWYMNRAAGFDKWGCTNAPPNGSAAQQRWQCD